jgi:ABC-type lipoprotein export system ATPase subunit
MLTNPSLLELERTIWETDAIIERKKRGKWRRLDQLSIGERCALLLTVLLVNNKNILIIDQPEDELDYH